MRTLDTLPTLDQYTPAYEADPHAVHRDVLAAGPVAAHPFGLAVLGYDEVTAALRNRLLVAPEGQMLGLFGVTEGPLWDRAASNILSLDGAEHARLRRLVAQSFKPSAADGLRLRMQDTMRELLGGCGSRLDVVELVSTYPIAIICAMLGAPRQDWSSISRIADDVFRIFLPTVADDQPIILAALEAMDAYVDRLIEQRHREGLVGSDLVTSLIRAEEDGDRLTRDELRMLVGTMFNAGTDTTRNQLAAGIQAFAEHPQQWEMLRNDPQLAARAVDEIMRYCPSVLATGRVATGDTTVGDVAVKAGTFVMLVTSAANRDPAVFDDPDRFDITRDGPAPQLTFGGGIHYCLGVHLAKAEMIEALTQMAHRWVTIEPAGPAPWKPRLSVSGPRTLPIIVNRGDAGTVEDSTVVTPPASMPAVPYGPYQSIVVGTDCSATAQLAVTRAAELAKGMGAILHLVSAVDDTLAVSVSSCTSTAVPQWSAAAVEDRTGRVAAMADELRASGVRVETSVRCGDPVRLLVTIAAERDRALLVVGNRGLKGLRRMLGSVPNTVAHHSRTDLLVVHTT